MAKAAKPGSKTIGRMPTNLKRTPKNKSEKMTDHRWKMVIEAVANGKSRKQAAKFANISYMTLQAYLVSDIKASSQIHEAALIWKRKQWSDEDIDALLEQIMRGKTLPQAFEACGVSEDRQSSLYQIILKDKAMRKLYDEAREIQAETFVDDIIHIADDSEFDRGEDGEGKPNHELVNRARLRVDTRKFVMSTMNGKRFSEKKQLELSGEVSMNHAAVLTGGRKRVEKLGAKRKGSTIDNDTGVVQP